MGTRKSMLVYSLQGTEKQEKLLDVASSSRIFFLILVVYLNTELAVEYCASLYSRHGSKQFAYRPSTEWLFKVFYILKMNWME